MKSLDALRKQATGWAVLSSPTLLSPRKHWYVSLLGRTRGGGMDEIGEGTERREETGC